MAVKKKFVWYFNFSDMSYSSLCQIYTQKFNADILGVSERGGLPVFEFIFIHPYIKFLHLFSILALCGMLTHYDLNLLK